MYRREITREEIATLDLIQYEGPITVIDSLEVFEREIDQLFRLPFLGFDTETKPSFKKGRIYPTSLIQFASGQQAWIIRVSRIGYPGKLKELLSSDNIVKVGLGLNDDLRRLRADFNFEPEGFLDLQQYVQAFHIEEKGLKKIAGIVLGQRISKSQQVSNWESDLLTAQQLRYAATDAWICLEIYNALKKSF